MKQGEPYWFSISDYDFETAKALLFTGRYLYVGFMCHQSVEKAMKAVYAAKDGKIPPKIHNLIRIARMAGLFERMSEEMRDLLYLLNPLNVRSRYPVYDDVNDMIPDPDQCAKMIEDTEGVLKWIRKLS